MWAIDAEAEVIWPDAPLHDDVLLGMLLEAAQEQCEAYAPPLDDDALIPARYTQAVILQARELWSASRRDGDLVGFDTYAVRVRPLSAAVKALLRPPRGAPRVR